jgi:hypothetical protein
MTGRQLPPDCPCPWVRHPDGDPWIRWPDPHCPHHSPPFRPRPPATRIRKAEQ